MQRASALRQKPAALLHHFFFQAGNCTHFVRIHAITEARQGSQTSFDKKIQTMSKKKPNREEKAKLLNKHEM